MTPELADNIRRQDEANPDRVLYYVEDNVIRQRPLVLHKGDDTPQCIMFYIAPFDDLNIGYYTTFRYEKSDDEIWLTIDKIDLEAPEEDAISPLFDIIYDPKFDGHEGMTKEETFYSLVLELRKSDGGLADCLADHIESLIREGEDGHFNI